MATRILTIFGTDDKKQWEWAGTVESDGDFWHLVSRKQEIHALDPVHTHDDKGKRVYYSINGAKVVWWSRTEVEVDEEEEAESDDQGSDV